MALSKQVKDWFLEEYGFPVRDAYLMNEFNLRSEELNPGIKNLDSENAKLAEAVLLGVVATRFPDKTLHFNRKDLNFTEAEANQFLDTEYRSF